MSIKVSIAFGLFIIALMISIWILNQKLSTLKKENSQLVRKIEQLSANYNITNDAYLALVEDAKSVSRKTDQKVSRIQSAPTSDDAPIAPVLRKALEDL